MPRPRTLLIAVAAFVAIILFARSSSSSDKTFYDNTVEKLHLKHEADRQHKMGTAAVMDAKLRDAAKQVKAEVVAEAAESRRKKGDDDDDDNTARPGAHDTKPRPGQKVMGGVDNDQVAKEPKEGKPHEVGTQRGKWTADDERVADSKPEQTDEERKMDAVLTSILKRSPIIIFSKTYCPFSKKAKAIFEKYSITPAPFIVEIDQHELGPQLQDKLLETTGRRTVPNVLINGKSIGGGDDVEALHDKGGLLDKIKSMGGKRIFEAKLAD